MIANVPNLKYINLNFTRSSFEISDEDIYQSDHYLLPFFENDSISIISMDLRNIVISSDTFSRIFEKMPQIENFVLYGIQLKNEMFWNFLLDLKNLKVLK